MMLHGPEKIKTTKEVCKALLKKKVKNEPAIVETADARCRAQLMQGRAFFVRRDLMRAFVVSTEDAGRAIAKPEAKSLKMRFKHPLGELTYAFNQKNSDKIRVWLSSTETAPA